MPAKGGYRVLKMVHICKNVADMHAAPKDYSEVVSQAIYASKIRVIKNNDPWLNIETEDHYQGWIKAEDATVSVYPSKDTIAHTCNIINHLYNNDSTNSKPVLKLPFGVPLEVIDSSHSRWIKVKLVNEKTAWIQSGDLNFSKKILSIKEMIEFSRRFLGLPYTWGGTSSFGFDCSGFTQFLYQQMGISLPRDAYMQAETITNRGMIPGNLLFFKRDNKPIHHVGMYIGKDKFIHATTAEPHGPPIIQISNIKHNNQWRKDLIS
jgi:gamma-D-glutamyl-L-lysine dipeptidyl-peptidase